MFKNINIFHSILAILIISIPLYPKFPLTNVSGTYVAIRLDDIIVASAIFIWFLYQILKGFPILKLKINKLFLLYFLAITASTITSILIYQTEPPKILLLNFLRRFEYMSLFFLTITSIQSRKDFKFPYVFLVITTALVAAYGFGQKYFKLPIVSTMNAEFSKGQLLQVDIWTRINSTFAGHYDLAAYLSVVLIIIGSIIVLKKNIFLRIINLIVWIASFQIFVLTASRISTFAFWGGICLTFFLLRKYLWIIPVSVLMILSIFNSTDLKQRLIATLPKPKAVPTAIPTPTPIPTPAPIPTPGPKIKIKKIIPTPIPVTPIPTVIRHQPMEAVIPIDTDVGVARSGQIRFNVEWPRAINAFKKNVLTGSGLGSITLATDNDYLRLLGESGALGFISFFALLMFFIIKTIPIIFKKDRDFNDNLNIIFLGCLLTSLANAVFIDIFEASKTAYMFWIIMGIYHQSLCLKK